MVLLVGRLECLTFVLMVSCHLQVTKKMSEKKLARRSRLKARRLSHSYTSTPLYFKTLMEAFHPSNAPLLCHVTLLLFHVALLSLLGMLRACASFSAKRFSTFGARLGCSLSFCPPT